MLILTFSDFVNKQISESNIPGQGLPQAPQNEEELRALNSAQIERFRYAAGIIMSKFKFFGSLMSKLEIIFTNKVKTACVDGSRMWVSPLFVSTLTDAQIRFLIGHEILHCVFGHFARRGNRDPKRWNVATDLEINPRLLDEGIMGLPELKQMRGLYNAEYIGKSAEEIYQILEDKARDNKEKQKQQQKNQQNNNNQDDSDGEDGESMDEVLNPQEGDELDEQVDPGKKDRRMKEQQQKEQKKKEPEKSNEKPQPEEDNDYQNDGAPDYGDDLEDEDEDDQEGNGVGNKGDEEDEDDQEGNGAGEEGEEDDQDEGEGNSDGEDGDSNDQGQQSQDQQGQQSQNQQGQQGQQGQQSQDKEKDSKDSKGKEGKDSKDNGDFSNQSYDNQAGEGGSGSSQRTPDNPNGLEGDEGGTKNKSAVSGGNVQYEGRKMTADDWMNLAKKAAGEFGASAGIRETLARMVKPKVNWKKEISRIIATAHADTEWKLPNRRFIARGEYRYSAKEVITGFQRIEIMIDTSGSINEKQIQHFLSEITDLMKKWKIQNVELIYFDHAIQGIDNLYLAPKFDKSKMRGGGGTKFMPWINHVTHVIKRERKPVDLVIVFTDGENYGEPNPLPAPPWYKKCLWIIFDNFGHQIPWGRKIEISTKDLF